MRSWHMKDTSKSLRMLAGFCRKLKSNTVPQDGKCWLWCACVGSEMFRPYLWGGGLLFELTIIFSVGCRISKIPRVRLLGGLKFLRNMTSLFNIGLG